MNLQSPQLKLQAGLTIGYSQALASAAEDISLGGGTHFLIARNGRGKTTLLRTLAKTLKGTPKNPLRSILIPQRRVFRLPADRMLHNRLSKSVSGPSGPG